MRKGALEDGRNIMVIWTFLLPVVNWGRGNEEGEKTATGKKKIKNPLKQCKLKTQNDAMQTCSNNISETLDFKKWKLR